MYFSPLHSGSANFTSMFIARANTITEMVPPVMKIPLVFTILMLMTLLILISLTQDEVFHFGWSVMSLEFPG